MKATRMFELTKDDIRSAILNYVKDTDYIDDDYFIDRFEVTSTDDDNRITIINMNEGICITDVKCFITAYKTK